MIEPSHRATKPGTPEEAVLAVSDAYADGRSEAARHLTRPSAVRSAARLLASLGVPGRSYAALPLAVVVVVVCIGLALCTRTAIGQTGSQQSETLPADTQPAIRFAAVRVFVDSREAPLAAYQFELSATAGEIKIVGVEGGEHPAFVEPPYYDPKALQHERIVIAAFSTSDDLPTGKTCVARLHLAVIGETKPEYEIKRHVTATTNGKTIPATVSVAKGEEP